MQFIRFKFLFLHSKAEFGFFVFYNLYRILRTFVPISYNFYLNPLTAFIAVREDGLTCDEKDSSESERVELFDLSQMNYLPCGEDGRKRGASDTCRLFCRFWV